ncbi:serine/threonine-protein kinase PAK 6 [Eurytemora carolleeae]|uniref:serine/threonine-protein kinase PAK 6 n=1 Tax=Eurytemora carolleeae TaxID=1294199 RepID=UPI000C773E36|nr:serine/threonine-protein kinase PAK 6 [Eurytemora carolleeae]|eukprot:XP_023328123.1 serine/threonine-protein kinase PAK 6-like [Eurytemora affinis]
MSPEILRGAPYDTLVDIWSLGVTVIEMIDREPPNFNVSPLIAMKKTRDGQVPKPVKSVSKSLADFIECMLEVDPEKRSTAEELLEHSFLNQTFL